MSTRSGKRIHNSFHENTEGPDSEIVVKSERKTRSKRAKDTNEELNVTVPKLKKRSNYVTYPTDDELTVDEQKPKRKRNALKDQNITVIPKSDPTTSVRQTRRTKKFIDNSENIVENDKNIETVSRKRNGKQSKKKEKENDTTAAVSKKKSKKKKQSFDLVKSNKEMAVQNELNTNTTSDDSFHSAAGSLDNEENNDIDHKHHELSNEINTFVENDDFIRNKSKTDSTDSSKTRRRLSIKVTPIKIDNSISTSPFKVFDNNLDKDSSACNVINSTFDMETKRNSKGSPLSEDVYKQNSTFEKMIKLSITKPHGSTYDKDAKPDFTIDSEIKRKSNERSFSGNSTFEKSINLSLTKPLDSTYEKDTKLDSTYDKKESSVMTSESENAVNVTFDKSNSSRISITSDESKMENILNVVPVLIESSINESQISNESLKLSKNSKDHFIISNDLLSNSKKSESSDNNTESKPPSTPLKREDTFTKDGPDVIVISPKPKDGLAMQISLFSPGCTPFQTKTRSTVKERTILNVTRSLEKSRRSLSIPPASRTTKVMFCSPVNNPALVNQRKSKIIKSNLKGSNKSFLFDENESLSVTCPSGRKRSFTYSDAEDVRAKRKRYAEDLQKSAERLSRPRTSTTKLAAPTPSKTILTPKSCTDTKARRKLPNFAALHEKQFAKMESLDELQERKAKRARKLLMPKGSTGVLEKGTPKASSTDLPKSKEAQKPETTQGKISVSKSGYTRFGFKLNLDVNPFSIPPKSNTKITSNPPGPSALETTTVRREIAKKVVMKEKVPTEVRRDVGRKKNRTIIKGVRTNRRFELQMMTRNMKM